MYPYIKKVLITEKQLATKISELAKIVEKEYKNKEFIMLGLLKGCIPFMSDISKKINLLFETHYLDVSSYEGKTRIEGKKLVFKNNLEIDVKNKEILIIEDIIDTGLTLEIVKKYLTDKGAIVKIMTLLDKPETRINGLVPDYYGFKIPNEFVIGYGLDFNEKYRNIPFIGILKEEYYK